MYLRLCLPNDQQCIFRLCETMISDNQDNLKCMITGDETWIYAYDPKTTEQLREYLAKDEARPKSRSRIKVMMTVFFRMNEFIPPG